VRGLIVLFGFSTSIRILGWRRTAEKYVSTQRQKSIVVAVEVYPLFMKSSSTVKSGSSSA
jgi:hypothetical protein